MSKTDLHTPPPEFAPDELLDGLDVLDGEVSVSASDAAHRVWLFFISMRTGLFLMLGLGVLSLIGTLLVQAPAGITKSPEAYSEWLNFTARPKVGGWTPVLDLLGFFSIFTSFWFRAISILLTTSILACTINRVPRLWKVAFHPRTHMGESFFIHAPLRAEIVLPMESERSLEQVRQVFASHRFRTISEPTDEALNLYADRFRWGPFGTAIAHISFVIIVLGVFITATTGFKDTQVAVTVGSRVAVGGETGLSIEAKSFADAYYPEGSPKDYASELILYKNGTQVAAKTVRVNHPMNWGGFSVYQAFFGVAAMISVKDGTGWTIFDQAVPLVWSSKDRSHTIGQFNMENKGLGVYVVSAASGKPDPEIKAGQVQLEIHQSGQENGPFTTQVISQGRPTTIAGLEYTFERTRQFTGLIVARDPGAIYIWVGSTLLVLGLILVFFFPHRRVWVRVRQRPGGSQILLGSTMRRDPMFEPQFHGLITEIQLAGTPPGITQSTTER